MAVRSLAGMDTQRHLSGDICANGHGCQSPAMQHRSSGCVGANVQLDQDRIQSYGVLVTTSTDVSGPNRPQFLDRNWYVCGQNFAPGTQMTGELEAVIDFIVAKIGGSC